MREIKSKRELELDTIVYPWQVMEGQGETWLILRQRKLVDTVEIKELRDVMLNESSWTIAIRQAGRSLYKGNIGFTVYYMDKDVEETDDVVSAEAPQEESSCRRLFNDGKAIVLTHMKKRESPSTIFPSILKDQVKTAGQHGPEPNGVKTCEISMPWQAWLYGEGESGEPEVVKVHLGMDGLKTILLEVAVKIQVKQDLRLTCFTKYKCALPPKEEVLYTIQEVAVQEVIGAVVDRAFYAASVDPLTAHLNLRYFKKTIVIFVSAVNGGERILTASALNYEQTKMTGIPAPPVPPVFYRCLIRTKDVLAIDANKVLCKNEYLWLLDYTGENLKDCQQETKAAPLALVPGDAAPSQSAIPPRQRPGEKWLKKTGKQANKPTKTGLCLKIVK